MPVARFVCVYYMGGCACTALLGADRGSTYLIRGITINTLSIPQISIPRITYFPFILKCLMRLDARYGGDGTALATAFSGPAAATSDAGTTSG